jgi:hypothetical protein
MYYQNFTTSAYNINGKPQKELSPSRKTIGLSIKLWGIGGYKTSVTLVG